MLRKLLILSFFIIVARVVVAQAPVADFICNNTSGCIPVSVSFASTSTGNPTSYYWDFGNGNTSIQQNPSAQFTVAGKYTVSLTVTNANGTNTITKTDYITVFANPVADFNSANPGGCSPDTVCFVDASLPGSGAINKWSWDFGDGHSSAQQSPCNAYTFSNNFNITLVVTDVNGCKNTVIKNGFVSVTPGHTVNFKADSTFRCHAPLTVHFSDLTTPANPSYTYLWDFGDGGTSTLKNPVHSYLTKGAKTVTLTVSTPNGCTQTVSKADYILIPDLVAAFSLGNTAGCPPLKVTATNLSSAATGTTGVTYLWTTMPAGVTSNQKEPTLIFNTPGSYSVKLTVMAMGCSDSKTLTTGVTVYDKPTALFIPAISTFCDVPAVVNFSSSSSSSDVTGWYWDFGDGTTSTQQNPSKTYSNFGKYNVSLIVTNANGCKDTLKIDKAVQIGKSGFILNLNPFSGCKPLKVTFDKVDTSIVPLTSWEWKINGVTVSTQSRQQYTFNDTGTYTVTCTGTNSSGCMFSGSGTVRVGMPPTADFKINKHTACYNDGTFHFSNRTNTHNPKADQFIWTIGKGGVNNTAEDTAFNFTVQDTGAMQITLIAYFNGCPSLPLRDSITVYPPIADFELPIVNCSNDTLQFRDGSIGGSKWYWTFGDGTVSTLKNPKHQYLNPGDYTITLTVRDTIVGCEDSVSNVIQIPATFKPFFTQSDTIGCPGKVFTFNDQSTTGPGITISSWIFYFGDGSVIYPGTQFPTPNVSVSFNSGGYFYAQYTVKDSRGCIYTYFKDSAVHIYTLQPRFNLSPDKGCVPLMIGAKDSSFTDFRVLTRKWYWGTGDSTIVFDSATYTASHLFTTHPTAQNNGYQVKLVIIDSMGCTASVTQKVWPSWPVPDFTTNIIKRCGYDSITFQSTSAGYTPLSYAWNFNYGDTTSKTSPIRKYSGDTIYSMKLLVKDANGCADSVYKNVPVHAKLPKVGFTAFPLYIPCPPGVVNFSDTSVMGGDTINKWDWDLGEGTISSLKDPAKTYYRPGIFPVSLKVTDKIGCTSATTQPGYIIIGGPLGVYSFSPLSGCTPLTVSLTASSSNATKIEWDLADGSAFDTLFADSHMYDRPSIYIPSVILTDSNGCKIPLTPKDTIVVYPLPQPDFTASKTAICKGGIISFMDQTTHPNNLPIKSHLWMFGTGAQDTSSIPVLSFKYDTAGRFPVTLIVTDTLGCTDTITKDSMITVVDDTIPPRTPRIYRATTKEEVENILDVLVEYTPNDEVDWAKYTLYYNYNGTPVPLSSRITSNIRDTVFAEIGVNTLDNVYSYTVTATDVCDNESPLSVKNTTMELKATGVINANKLIWKGYYGWDSVNRYEIFRMNPDSSDTYVKIAEVPGTDTTYIDTNIYCFKPFYYRIKAIEDGGMFQFSWSDTSGAVPIFQTTVPGTRNIRATVVADSYVLLQWRGRKHKLPFTYVIYRAVDDQEPLFYKELNSIDTFLVDRDVEVDEHSYTYITYLKDNCGGMSPESNIARTILLKADLQQNDILKYDPVITWSPYRLWSTGVDYYKVEFYYDSAKQFSTLGIKNPDELTLSHTYVNLEQYEYCYLVTAYQKDSQDIYSESNIRCISTAPRLYAPNVITINGDNLNEVFQLGGVFLDTYHIAIYDRWGELMFESNDIHQSWDGTYKGKPCQSDVFVYIAEGTGHMGQRVSIKGNVTLLR